MSKRLGKGIEALISSKNFNQEKYVDGFLEISKIKINSEQPRKYFDKQSLNELVESIREKGILQAITVKENDDNSFELISGERRLRAAKTLKLKTIPAYIIDINSDAEKLELALIENIQRNDLNAIEEAEAYILLKLKYNLTHSEIAKRVGKSRIEITRTIELTKLPKNIKESLIKHSNTTDFSFTKGHARTILGLKKPIKIQMLYNRILKEKLSVRETERIVRKINAKNSSAKTFISKKNIFKSEKILTNIFDAKVEVLCKKNDKGYIKIIFESKKDKQRILEIIQTLKK